MKSLHPRDDHYGMGCLEAAIAAATVHNGASRWNKSLLDNAARPSGALVYEPEDGSLLSGDQFDRLQKELAEVANDEMWQIGKVVRSLRPENKNQKELSGAAAGVGIAGGAKKKGKSPARKAARKPAPKLRKIIRKKAGAR